MAALIMPDLSTTGERSIDTPPGQHRGLPAYCGCCGCITRYCNCSCCCQRGGSGLRGNSYANGQSACNGPRSPWSWRSGFQAPRPVTHWDFTEGRNDGC